jgi:hypothetical protein
MEKQRLNRSIGWLPGSGDLNWEASRNAATGEAGFSNQECQNRRINEARRLPHHFTMEHTLVALPCAPALGKSMSCLPSWVPGFRIQILHSPRRRERSKRMTIACKSRPKRHALPSFLGLKARPRLRLRYGWLPNSNFPALAWVLPAQQQVTIACRARPGRHRERHRQQVPG